MPRKPAEPPPFELTAPVLAKELPTGPQWVHEIKHDGHRCAAVIEAGTVRLVTRSHRDVTRRSVTLAAQPQNSFSRLTLARHLPTDRSRQLAGTRSMGSPDLPTRRRVCAGLALFLAIGKRASFGHDARVEDAKPSAQQRVVPWQPARRGIGQENPPIPAPTLPKSSKSTAFVPIDLRLPQQLASRFDDNGAKSTLSVQKTTREPSPLSASGCLLS